MVTDFDKVQLLALAMADHARTHKFMRWVDDDVVGSKYRFRCSECESQFAITPEDLRADRSEFARKIQDGLYRRSGSGGRNGLSELLVATLPPVRRTAWDRIDTEDPLNDELTWDNVYLLGWHDAMGKAFLTTWHDDGTMTMVNVVITGASPMSMPMWNAPVPMGAKVHRVPDDVDPKEWAKKLGGFHAFGWRVPKVERKARA